MLTLLFDKMICLKLQKKWPDVFLRASHTNFESCDHLNNHIYKDASRIVLPNDNNQQMEPAKNSSMCISSYVDLLKCANQIVEATEIAQ